MSDEHELTVVGGPLPAPQSEPTLDAMAREVARDPRLASPHTRRTYLGALRDFETWRAGRPVTRLLVEAYGAHLRDQGAAVSTINHKLAAVRWWSRRLGELAREDRTLSPAQRREVREAAEEASQAPNVRGQSAPRGRHVPDGEVRALLAACASDPGPAGVRDGTLIALAFATGARRAELAGLALADVQVIEDGYLLTVRHGKGDKSRTVSVHNGARDWLRDWLALRGDAEGPLFLAVNKGGTILAHGLGTQSLQELLGKRARQASVPPVHWHDARRTAAGNLLDAGADLALVQGILGHSSPVTTAAYDRRPEAARRRALQRLHVPYLR